MANAHDDRFVLNLSAISMAEENVQTTAPEGSSMIHSHPSQELAQHDHLKKKACSNMASTRGEKHDTPKPLVKEDCSADLTETSFEIEDIEDHLRLAAQADSCKTISLVVMESHSQSNKHDCEGLRFNHDDVIDMSQSAKEIQQEVCKSKHIHMNPPPVMTNLYQYAMFANTMSHEVKLQQEHEVAPEEPTPTDNKSQTMPWKDLKKYTEHRKDESVASYRCAQQIAHLTCTSSSGEEQVPVQCSRQSRRQTFANPTGNFSNDYSRHKNDVDKFQEEACSTLETCSEPRLESGISMCLMQHLDDVETFKSIADENEKSLYHHKEALAHAPPVQPPTRQVGGLEATIPSYTQSGIVSTPTYGERPGAYVVVPSRSPEETTRLPFAHENWSCRHDFDEESQQDVISNFYGPEQRNDLINIAEGQIRPDMNNPVEAEPVEAIFAEVVVWYKRRLFRCTLVVFLVLVIAIIVLGLRLDTGVSSPTLLSTLVPTSVETLGPPAAESLPPTVTSPTLDPELIACTFLSIPMDLCLETTSADGSQPMSSIPSELGVLTKLTSLSLDSNQLTGTIPSEIGAMTRLTTMSLRDNDLTGSIPSEIGAMMNLTYLDVSENHLTGTIPPEMGALSRLTTLSLWDNNLSGNISVDMGAMTRLITLSLWDNNLTGNIPSEIGAMIRVTTLSLRENDLTGSIPSEIGAMINLTYLDVSENHLTGTIPPEMGALSRLTTLSLGDNNLSGTISADMGAMTRLITLSLWDNNLTGNIPSEMGAMIGVTTLSLRENDLTGNIPSEIGAMIKLTYLDVSENQLTGTIPSEMGALTNLSCLSLQSNQLTSTIPSIIGTMTQLITLSLTDNYLTGNIPSETGAMTSLANFSFSDNDLNGTIPSEMVEMVNLTYYDVSENQLTGNIPSELGALSSLTYLSLESNQLTGTIPSEMVSLSSLSFMDVSDNQLSGSIPSELFLLNLASRIDMYVQNNALSGTISTALCQPTNVIYIDCGEIECSCCSSFDETTNDGTPCT